MAVRTLPYSSHALQQSHQNYGLEELAALIPTSHPGAASAELSSAVSQCSDDVLTAGRRLFELVEARMDELAGAFRDVGEAPGGADNRQAGDEVRLAESGHLGCWRLEVVGLRCCRLQLRNGVVGA